MNKLIGTAARGFTLIELSIVLVIIGLIVGGVLTGQSLIGAAAVRAQITQIEKFNQAANTFFGKYGYLPGDIPAAPAAQFGFAARGTSAGQGDGNGLIEGVPAAVEACGFCVTAGETAMFWEDLTTANGLKLNLIEGSFSTADITNKPVAAVTGAGIGLYMPPAKIGNGNYIYVWEGGPNLTFNSGADTNSDNHNYFGLSAVSQVGSDFLMASAPGLTVSQANSIDTKVDDGLPQLGNVKAIYLNITGAPYGVSWAAGGGATGAASTSATPGSATTCYDNRNVGGATQQYSNQIGGANMNCALSFRMQAGD